MTETDKPVTRRTRGLYHLGGRPRKIVVTIGPGDVLEFREERRRERYYVPIESTYRQAVFAEVMRRRREKKLQKARAAR